MSEPEIRIEYVPNPEHEKMPDEPPPERDEEWRNRYEWVVPPETVEWLKENGLLYEGETGLGEPDAEHQS